VYRDDWLERLLEQLGAIVGRMAGLRDNHDEAGMAAEAERAWDLLGIRRELAVVVDTTTLAGMLGTPEKIRAAADLLMAEGLGQRADELRRLAVFKSRST
jgi:hypothetical protein